MVRPAGGQVEHVAGLQHPVLFGVDLEGLEDTQVDAAHDGCVIGHLAAKLPAALTAALEQEDIVLVQVRADAAAWRRVADHDVIQAPARQEGEVLQQGGDLRHIVIHRLYQQGPVALRQAGEGGLVEGAVADLPGTVGALFLDQTGLDIVLAGEPGQFVWRQRVVEVGEGATDQQRLLLPDIAQELCRCQAAQQGEGGVS